MLRMVLTGQVKGADLLEGALLAFLYFLPSILAFLRGHSRFFIILGLNVALAPVQRQLLRVFVPGMFRRWPLCGFSPSSPIWGWDGCCFWAGRSDRASPTPA